MAVRLPFIPPVCLSHLAHDFLNSYTWTGLLTLPAAPTTGTGRWAESYAQAVALVAQMTNAEKENITYGYTSTTNGCSGNSGGVPRLNFPGLCLNDAGNGVRGSDLTNGYAAGVHVGAAWNKELAYDRARFMGAEFKAKGSMFPRPLSVPPFLLWCIQS